MQGKNESGRGGAGGWKAVRRLAAGLGGLAVAAGVCGVIGVAGGCSRGDACCDISGPERSAAERVSDATLFERPLTGQEREVVGVYDRTRVLIAYYASPLHAQEMNALRRRRDEANARGEAGEAARCEREGQERQHTAHLQLARKAPLTNVAHDFNPQIEQVARAAGVTRVVAHDASAHAAGTVDVTEALVKGMRESAGERAK